MSKSKSRRAQRDAVATELVVFDTPEGEMVAEVQVDTLEATIENSDRNEFEAALVPYAPEPIESEYGPEVLPTDDPRWKSSVVPAKYRRQYAKHDESCGDTIAKESKAYLTVDTEDGPKLNLELLVRWAEANGCWVESYSKLNPGMQRMNVVNRLRAKIRKGHVVAWI
jgi:hypothetical protein